MAKRERLNETAQHKAFKEAARALDCNESEDSFDRALGKIGRAAPEPKPAPAKKRKPLKIALPDA